jgi:hypothetical protein
MKNRLICVLLVTMVGATAGCAKTSATENQALAVAQPLEPGARLAAVATPPRVDTALLASLPAQAQATIAVSKLPVLVAAVPLDGFTVLTDTHYVATAGHRMRTLQDGQVSDATVSLHSTNVVHDIEGLAAAKPTHTVHGLGAQFTINEGVATVTWEEFGMAFALDVECSQHEDARCHDAAFVVAEADALRLVGGAK